MTVLVDIYRPLSRRRAVGAARPRLKLAAIAVPLSLRRGVAIGAVILALVSVLLYILAVNAILFHGIALQRSAAALGELERDRAALEGELFQRRSPAWLAKTADGYGMVGATGVRYLTPPPPVALSR